MAMYCPNCNQPRAEALACPLCGQQLLPGVPHRPPGFVGRWMQSVLGRVVVGVLLAQGLFHAARYFATGILLATLTPDGVEAFHTSLAGVAFWQALQGLALLAGAALAGSTDGLGFFHGLLVGVANGVICAAFPLVPGTASGDLAVFGQPLIQAAVGVVGGWLGSLVWRPAPDVLPNRDAGQGRRSRTPLRKLLHGPIQWWRVSVGALVAVVGAVSAGALFDGMLEASRGRLATESYLQDRIITWEIKILLLLFGGAVAGANTPNGFKQGLVVGLMASLALALLPRYNSSVQEGAILFFVTVALCTTGGWFGGQLLPPLLRRVRPKHWSPMA